METVNKRPAPACHLLHAYSAFPVFLLRLFDFCPFDVSFLVLWLCLSVSLLLAQWGSVD